MAMKPFDQRYDVDQTSKCWNWNGALIKQDGYGLIMVNGKHTRAHRRSYEIHVGPIPPDLVICHHCDNRRCVNPAHLYAGTRGDNARDMVRRGRVSKHQRAQGERNGGGGKLSAAIASLIFRSRLSGPTLSAMFGVATVTIDRIRSRTIWRCATNALSPRRQ